MFKTLRKRRLGSSERGSEIVEFAIVIAVLCTLMFGIMDFSRALFAYHWVSYAAREATRYASVHGSTYGAQCPTSSPWVATTNCQVSTSSTANITNYVQSFAQGIYFNGSTTGAGGLTVTTTWPGTTGSPINCSIANGNTNNPGCPVKVVVQYIYGFTLPFISYNLSTITMNSTSQVVISQ